MSEDRPWRIAGVETDARQFAEKAAGEAGVDPATWIDAAIRARTGLGTPGAAAKDTPQEDPEITRSRVLRMLRRLEYRVGEQDSRLMTALGPLANSLAGLDERLRNLESAAGVVRAAPRAPAPVPEEDEEEDWSDADSDDAGDGFDEDDAHAQDDGYANDDDLDAEDADEAFEDEDLDALVDATDEDAFAAADEDDDEESAFGRDAAPDTPADTASPRTEPPRPADNGVLSRDDDLPIGFAGTIPFPGPRTPPRPPALDEGDDGAPATDTAPPEGASPPERRDGAPDDDMPSPRATQDALAHEEHDDETPADPRTHLTGRTGGDRAEPHLGSGRMPDGAEAETRRSARIEPLFGRSAPSDDDLREADEAVRADLHRLFDDGDRASPQPAAQAVVDDGPDRERYEALETKIAGRTHKGKLAMLAVIALLMIAAAGIAGFFYLQLTHPERLASLDPRQLLQSEDPPPISPDPPPAETGTGTPSASAALPAPATDTASPGTAAPDTAMTDTAPTVPADPAPPPALPGALTGPLTNPSTGEAAPAPASLPSPEPATSAATVQDPNEPAALRQIREAALAGDPKAQNELGVRYLVGQDVPQDYGQAALWLRRAAETGIASAQYNLGVLYDSGRGVEADPVEALIWFHAAAEKGHGRAQLALAAAFAAGRGIERNPDEALRWLDRAANANVLEAQTSLARILSDGRKSREQLADAVFWYRVADANGAPQAASEAERIASVLSPEERATVSRRVSRFLSERLARPTPTPVPAASTPPTPSQPAEATPPAPTSAPEPAAPAPAAPPAGTAPTPGGAPPPAELPPAPTPAPPPPPLTDAGPTPPPSEAPGSVGTANPQDSANAQAGDEIDPAMVSEIQRLLTTLGFDPGPADGKMGDNTRTAISEYQRAFAMTPIDGMPSKDLLAHLRRVVGAKR